MVSETTKRKSSIQSALSQKLSDLGAKKTVDEGQVGEERLLYSWSAPIRPFKKRDRDYYTTIASIAFLIIVILFFLKELLLIAVVIAFAFVSYVLAAIPPENIEHQLTNRGVRTGEKLYRWGDMQRYWINEKNGHG